MLLNERKSTSPIISPIYEGVEMVYFWMKYGSPSDPNASYPTREKPRSRRSVTSFWWSSDIWPGIYQKSRLRLPETHQKIIIHRELWNRRLPGILWDTGCFSKKKWSLSSDSETHVLDRAKESSQTLERSYPALSSTTLAHTFQLQDPFHWITISRKYDQKWHPATPPQKWGLND